MQPCPFAVGEIAHFDCPYRKEKYIARIEKRHIDKWGTRLIPVITRATTEQKQQWYEKGDHELILESYGKPPGFMGIRFSFDDL